VTSGDLSNALARRIALGAQGFTDPRPTGRVDRRHLRRVVERMGLVQIDSVNVVARSHELVLFARLGAHPRTLIDEAARAGEVFEYWVHEACHAPVEIHPYMRWRMAAEHQWGRVAGLRQRRPDFIDEVRTRLREDGPLVAGDLRQRVGPKGTWWDWDDGKIALEHLFHCGEVAALRRPSDFARVYDLAERVLPASVLAARTPSEPDARKELLVRAARHLGVATFEDLTDYHRQRNPPCRPLVAELVEEGRLVVASVEGWDKPAYHLPGVRRPRTVAARALLSPFDPVVWNRQRAQRLWAFRYRVEIYVPEAKRQHGYYVLPFLLGDRLVARVDLKADRVGRQLLVRAAFDEPGVPALHVAHELAHELQAMAEWLGLERGVAAAGRGDLIGPLDRELRSLVRSGTLMMPGPLSVSSGNPAR
jgi:uncharacterized protein